MADGRHFEPFLHLVDVTDTSALVAWGGFYLAADHVVDDDDLDAERREGGTIGARSPAYGAATVEVFTEDGTPVATAATKDANSVWIEGLEPDTAYTYRVTVDGEPWADGERADWQIQADGPGRLEAAGRRYDPRFRTHPAEDDPQPVTFLALGDYGVGIVNGENGRRQQGVARTMEALARTHPVRFVVSLGDNIYHGEDDRLEQSGDEDDDWYFTFYEPYRYLVDHLPVYPAAGNHDGSDEEASDDRAQLADNFHLESRFRPRVEHGRASLEPGLFYSIRVGAHLELVCVDTTWGEEQGSHFFDDDDHRRWLEQALPDDGDTSLWRIPFCHHPAHCAGPHHENMPEQIDRLLPLYRRAGVRVVLSGHEHNFQHGHADGIDQIISGAAAKVQENPPFRWSDGGTQRWASEPHCLLVEVEPDRLMITPYGPIEKGEEPVPIRTLAPDGTEVDPRIVISR